MLGDVGQRLLSNAIQREPHRGRDPILATAGLEADGQAGLGEIVDKSADVTYPRFGGNGSGGTVEQPDGATDVGHRLSPQPLGLLERVDRIVDVAVQLEATAGSSDVQQGHAQ